MDNAAGVMTFMENALNATGITPAMKASIGYMIGKVATRKQMDIPPELNARWQTLKMNAMNAMSAAEPGAVVSMSAPGMTETQRAGIAATHRMYDMVYDRYKRDQRINLGAATVRGDQFMTSLVPLEGQIPALKTARDGVFKISRKEKEKAQRKFMRTFNQDTATGYMQQYNEASKNPALFPGLASNLGKALKQKKGKFQPVGFENPDFND